MQILKRIPRTAFGQCHVKMDRVWVIMIASLFRQHWEGYLTYLSLFCGHSAIGGSKRLVLSILKILCEQSQLIKRIRTNNVFSSTVQNNLCSLGTKAGVSIVIHKNQILCVEKKKKSLLFLRSLYCLYKDSISDPTHCFMKYSGRAESGN